MTEQYWCPNDFQILTLCTELGALLTLMMRLVAVLKFYAPPFLSQIIQFEPMAMNMKISLI